MLGWKKHQLESRLPGKISITSYMQMTPPLWKKVKRKKKASWWKWKLSQQPVSDERNCSQRKFLTKISHFSYLTNYCLLYFLWSQLSSSSHMVTCNIDSFTSVSIFFLASLSVKLAVPPAKWLSKAASRICQANSGSDSFPYYPQISVTISPFALNTYPRNWNRSLT